MSSWQNQALRLAQYGFRALYGDFRALDVEDERRQAAFAERFFRPPAGLRSLPVSAHGVPAEWLIPADLSSGRVLLYVHGGAFYSGTLAGARPVASQFAQAARARGLTIDYRLTPEHAFPAALEDTQKAYTWLLDSGVAPEEVVLVGDSAGGNLVLALLLQLREAGQPLPGGAVCLSPTTDLTLSGETWITNRQRDLLLNRKKVQAAVDLYLRGADPQNPFASPLYGDLSGLPPLLFLVGSEEHLLSDASRFAEKARAAGVRMTLEVWEGMQHGWHLLADFLPEGRQAIERVAQFIASQGEPVSRSA